MVKQQQKKRVVIKKQQQKTARKRVGKHKKQTFAQGFAEGLLDVGKAALPLLSMFPFETSGGYAQSSGNYGAINSVAAPVANATSTRTLKARVQRSKSGNMSVCHREYLSDIVLFANDLFNIQLSQNINPGNGSLFPWLSTLARNFEKFKFNNLKFIYEPQSSTTTPGTVMMAVDWDAKDTNPSSKVEMMSYEGASRSPTWFPCYYTSQPKNLHAFKQYFITDGGSSPTGTDIHLYSVGKFIIATMSDQAVASSIGELYVEYDVELITPQLEFSCPSGALIGTVGASYSVTKPLGSGINFNKYGSIGLNLKDNVTNNAALAGQGIQFLTPGVFLLAFRYALATAAAGSNPITLDNIAGEGAEDLTIFQSISSTAAPNIISGWLMNDTNTGIGSVANLQVKSPGATLFLRGNGSITPGAGTVLGIYIASMGADVWGGTPSTITPTLFDQVNRGPIYRRTGNIKTHKSVLTSVGESKDSSEVREEVKTVPSDSRFLPRLLDISYEWEDYLSTCYRKDKVPIDFLKWYVSCPLDKQLLHELIRNKPAVKSALKEYKNDDMRRSRLKRLVQIIQSNLEKEDITKQTAELLSEFQSLSINCDCALPKKV